MDQCIVKYQIQSLPLRKCGLKSVPTTITAPPLSSLPLRKCGLKLPPPWFLVFVRRHFPCGSVDWNLCQCLKSIKKFVTSLAEVWIEIGWKRNRDWLWQASLPLRKCGLKYRSCGKPWVCWGHFPCGSVDWNCSCCHISPTYFPSLPLRKCGLK